MQITRQLYLNRLMFDLEVNHLAHTKDALVLLFESTSMTSGLAYGFDILAAGYLVSK